jgi:hypothetical protein
MQPELDPRVLDANARVDAAHEFDEHVLARRKLAEVENEPAGAWALALSGGGIRSATFCLGLIRGLARAGLLKRFDYLSTVSGGGYLGASLGRLYSASVTATQVEQGVASQDSMWLWWLRNNGRYLTPAGAKDLGYASASILRGVISTHLEIGILILTMAALVLLPHFVVSLFPPVYDQTLWSYGVVYAMPSVWAWLLVIPSWVCLYQVCAYWYTRDRHSPTSVVLIVLTAAGCALIAAKAGSEARSSLSTAKYVLAVLATAPAGALIGVLIDRTRGLSASAQRLARTKRLSYGLWGLGICAALAVLDWGTWQLTRLFWGDQLHQAAYRIGGTALVLTAIGRLVLPELQRRMATIKGPSVNIQRALNILGIALCVVVAVLWTSVFSAALFPESARTVFWVPQWDNLPAIPPILTLALVLLGCAAYLLATRQSFDLLNLASLHNFYRARIERAYVSSGNCGAKGGRFKNSALDPVSPASTTQVAPLTEAIEGDDVELEAYRPHACGGPIHLINCCINQSVDDRTGLYNADRKGVALTVSALGVEVGTQLPSAAPQALLGRLSKWIAISGAAASTGMGSRTSPGFAALLFMSGIRLGFWTPSLLGTASGRSVTGLKGALLRWAPKPLAIVAESLARFPGLSSPFWYVSDGGHFDNTGIYALLKRRPSLIVAADCGADPKYLFGDLESLVRKAQIDYGTTIEFIPNLPGVLPPSLTQSAGTPETIQPELGSQWLVLGRMTYSNGQVGTLIVVKPRRLDSMPFDLVAYADRNPDFPQQTTGDQFFDEAQWESYHELGLLMGAGFSDQLIRDSVKATHEPTPAFSSLELSERTSLELSERQAATLKAKADRGKRAGFTVRETLGAGLSLSLVIAAWQGFEQYRETRRAEQRGYEKEIYEISQRIRSEPIDTLYKGQFLSLARESVARGDDAMETVLARLNSRCDSLPDTKSPDPKSKGECFTLYKDVSEEFTKTPKPFYDYWFLDKREAYDNLKNPAVASAVSLPAIPTKDNAGYMPGYAASTLAIGAADAACDLQLPSPSGKRSQCADETIKAPQAAHISSAKPCSRDVRVFVHVYDEQSRPIAQQEGLALMTAVGAGTAPVENVVATATRLGRASPYVWKKPTLVYPVGTDPDCIQKAIESFGKLLGLQQIGSGTANSLELWIPPRTLVSVSATQVSTRGDGIAKSPSDVVKAPPPTQQPQFVPRIDHLPLVRYAPGGLLSAAGTWPPRFNADATTLNLRQVQAVRIHWKQLTGICHQTTRPTGRLVVHGFASDDPVLDARGKRTPNSDDLNRHLANMRALGLAAVLEAQIKSISPDATVTIEPKSWENIGEMRALRDNDESLAKVGSGHSPIQDFRSATLSLNDFNCVARQP